jgi:hypothetical protein
MLMVLGTREAREGEAVDEVATNVDIGRGRALNCFFSSSSSGTATGRARLELAKRNGTGFVNDGGDLTEDPRGEGVTRTPPCEKVFLNSIVEGMLIAFSALETLARKELNRFGRTGVNLLPTLKSGIGLAWNCFVHISSAAFISGEIALPDLNTLHLGIGGVGSLLDSIATDSPRDGIS